MVTGYHSSEAPRPQGGASLQGKRSFMSRKRINRSFMSQANNIFLLYCAPYPAHKAGLAGAFPVKRRRDPFVRL